jgi:hypothetical protein
VRVKVPTTVQFEESVEVAPDVVLFRVKGPEKLLAHVMRESSAASPPTNEVVAFALEKVPPDQVKFLSINKEDVAPVEDGALK